MHFPSGSLSLQINCIFIEFLINCLIDIEFINSLRKNFLLSYSSKILLFLLFYCSPLCRNIDLLIDFILSSIMCLFLWVSKKQKKIKN